MIVRDRRSRPRHRHLAWTEPLEARRLLAATLITPAPTPAFATALPVPGLATGMGLASTAQTLPTVAVSVSPAPVASPFGPSATGPSTTLSPLPNDSETAVAAASEVARPTPGRSDRISAIVEAPEIVPLPHLRSPDADEVIPGPQIQARPPAPAPAPVPAPAPAEPARQKAEPAEPARPVAPAPDPVPKAAPEGSKAPMTFEAWDAALELVATGLPEGSETSFVHRTEAAMASGALLAAWGGWKYGSSLRGRSRRRPLSIAAVEAGPGDGEGR